MSMRLAIGVHGRFYAFDLGAALLDLDVDVRLYTNYPKSIVQRFGFPRDRTSSLLAHGIAARAAHRISRGREIDTIESALKRGFGSWLAGKIGVSRYDVAFCWSGIAEEAFLRTHSLKLLNRSSFHIAAQRELLRDERQRVGQPLQQPTTWIVERERREYQLADVIVVPSEAARRSFAQFGGDHRVAVVPLTAAVERWRPDAEVAAERARRIRAGEPLRVLYAGAVSYRKGMYDLAQVIARLQGRMKFRITGGILSECADLVRQMAGQAQFDGHIPEVQLRQVYESADVFVLPSIEDGFAVVLAQALAAGVPILASENSGAHELLAQGGRGWTFPIRSPDEIVARLQWCDENRALLAAETEALYQQPPRRTWHDVAGDLVRVALEAQRAS